MLILSDHSPAIVLVFEEIQLIFQDPRYPQQVNFLSPNGGAIVYPAKDGGTRMTKTCHGDVSWDTPL